MTHRFAVALSIGALLSGASSAALAVTTQQYQSTTTKAAPAAPAPAVPGAAPAAAPVPAGAAAPTAPQTGDDQAMTLRDAVTAVARHFDFAVVGTNRLGGDTPMWPAADDADAQMIVDSLLRDYSYAVILKPKGKSGAPRMLDTLIIVGHSDHAATQGAEPVVARAAPPPSPTGVAPAAVVPTLAVPLTSRAPAWAPRQSSVVRALTKLAVTSSDANTEGAPAAGSTNAPPANPAENAAAMAALTRSAQAGLGALVMGLRQACPTPNSC
jgi:hypothetical protein